MPRQLRLGNGVISELGNALAECHGTRVLVVTDPGLVKAGIAERVLEQLRKSGIPNALFDGVEPDPRIGLVQDCVAAAKASRADLLIGLGGGSALDIAKVAALIAAHDTPIADMVGIDRVPARGLPVIAMPTTAGTGSEVTPIAVLSDKQAHLKKGIVSQHLIPDVAAPPSSNASPPPASSRPCATSRSGACSWRAIACPAATAAWPKSRPRSVTATPAILHRTEPPHNPGIAGPLRHTSVDPLQALLRWPDELHIHA